MIVNLFAGPGGWCEGVRRAGYAGPMAGIEWDRDACATAHAAGHMRIRADVETYPTAPFRSAGVVGVIGSPPCPTWSAAGARAGDVDRAKCHTLIDRMAAGDDALDWCEWEDERSRLIAQPVRWVRDLRPVWVLLEQVPEAIGLWQHLARVFRGWGYAGWCGVLRADAYGVPQTRSRAILIARRGPVVRPPSPTHAKWPEEPEPDLFGEGLQRWVTMTDALGWGMSDRPSMTVTGGGTETGGAEPFGNGARKSMRREMERGRWVMMAAGQTGESRPRDPADAPAATLTGKGTAAWVDRDTPNCERVTPQECGILQSFRHDYPWQGNRGAQYRQAGDAVPPLLAAAIAKVVL